MTKIALVVGGGTEGGIGHAIVQALARDGVTIAVMDLDERLALSTAASVGGLGLGGDATEAADVAGAVAKVVETFGGLDIMVNNVGSSLPGDNAVADLDPDLWDRSLRFNARPAMLGCKYAIPALIARGGGAIVNTSSTSSLFGFTGISAYGAAKAAVNQITRMVATQYGKQNIRCNAVAPGYIVTPMSAARSSRQFTEGMVENILMPRAGQPEDIAEMVAFLASDKAPWLTGQIIPVDGGISAHAPQFATMRRLFGTGSFLKS
jgi:NAD(P)-dependent dehydrogenase (short-subunit alcohol dehydrogenase family)